MLNWCRYAGSLLTIVLSISLTDGARCGRVVNQFEDLLSKKGAHPWIVSLEARVSRNGTYTWDHMCSGTLLDREWILTAAHCFEEEVNVSEWRAIGGQYDLAFDECSEQILGVDKIFPHSNYSFVDAHDHRNDLAMIRVHGKFRTGGTYVRPICLPTTSMVFENDSACTIAGWSPTYSLFNASPEDMFKLFDYNATILSRDVCSREAEEISNSEHHVGEITEKMLCIKAKLDKYSKYYTELDSTKQYTESDNSKHNAEGGTGGTCVGDSGGPLICENNEHYFVAGISSWNMGHCGRNHDIFTGLHDYTQTLKKIMKRKKSRRRSTKAPESRDNCPSFGQRRQRP